MTFPSGVVGSIEITIAAEPSNLECLFMVMAENGEIQLGGKSLNTTESFDLASENNNNEYLEFKNEIT